MGYAVKINGKFVHPTYADKAKAVANVSSLVKQHIDKNHLTEGTVSFDVVAVVLTEAKLKAVDTPTPITEPEVPVAMPCDVEPGPTLIAG